MTGPTSRVGGMRAGGVHPGASVDVVPEPFVAGPEDLSGFEALEGIAGLPVHFLQG